MAGRLPSDDTELIRLAASCSKDAFCEVIDRFERYITLVIARFAPRQTDREDLRSEVVAKLLARKKRALKAWEPSRVTLDRKAFVTGRWISERRQAR